MQKYNNAEYHDLMRIIINDAFYVKGSSFDSRIFQIRKLTEIIVRRLLNYRCDYKLTLGNLKIADMLRERGFTEPLFVDSLDYICNGGNDRGHTQVTTVANEEEFHATVESLLNLFGYIFYKYFKTNKFGSNPHILTAFSILPPIIRHIALNELFNDDPTNTMVIDKLVLAKIKAFNQQEGVNWIENNKEMLQKLIVAPSDNDREQLISKYGKNFAETVMAQIPKSDMYELCRKKAETIGKVIERQGPLYTDFETALSYYNEHGKVEGSTKEIVEFNSLMEFVYSGRKAREMEVSRLDEKDYIISQMI